jgi:MFS family permease
VGERVADRAGAPPLWRAVVRNDRAAVRSHPGHRNLVLAVAMVGIAAGSFSNLILVASLPTIARDLGSTTSVVAWVNIAPAIAFAVSMPIFGKLGDLYGHRRVFLLGWSAATVLAFATAFAPNAFWLIALRAAAQLSGASTTPASYGLLASVFPPDERQQAFGKALTVLALSPVVAVSFGGPLVAAIGWRALFVSQGVIATVAVLLALPVLPTTPTKAGVRFDALGAVALAIGMVALLLGVNRTPEWGLDHRGVQVSLACGIAGLIAFVVIERRVSEPLVRLDWLARREVAAPIAANFAAHAVFMGLVVTAPFLVKRVFGYGDAVTAWLTGLRPAFYALGSYTCARITQRIGDARTQLLANSMLLASALCTYLAVRYSSLPLLLVNFAVGGFGLGAGRPAVIAAVNNSVTNADSGIANGMYSMSQQIGSGVGQTALVAAVGSSVAAAAYADAALVGVVLGVLAVLTGAAIHFAPRIATTGEERP